MRGLVRIIKSDCRGYVTMIFKDLKTGETWQRKIPAGNKETIMKLKRRFFRWVESRE